MQNEPLLIRGKHNQLQTGCYIQHDEQKNLYTAVVYEWEENSSKFHMTHKSHTYKDRAKANKAFERFCRKYL